MDSGLKLYFVVFIKNVGQLCLSTLLKDRAVKADRAKLCVVPAPVVPNQADTFNYQRFRFSKYVIISCLPNSVPFSLFLSSVAHELRTPIHGLGGQIELIRDEVNSTASDSAKYTPLLKVTITSYFFLILANLSSLCQRSPTSASTAFGQSWTTRSTSQSSPATLSSERLRR